MKELLDQLIRLAVGQWPLLAQVPQWVWYLAWMVMVGGIVLVAASMIAGITSWVERRIAGRMQARIGPNRVGPWGFFQWIADGLKSLFKEDVTPASADKPLFRLAPYLVFVGMFGAWAVLPYSARIYAADLNVGILYLMAITSLVVIGILMGGWASGNKWGLFGALRSSAQIVSYEVPAGIAITTAVLLSGTLSLQGMVKAQGGPLGILGWNIFNSPFSFVAFFIYFIAAIAEGNRTPFDLPEAESELVSGYNIEYSGMRFVFFFFAEWANLFLIGAVSTTLFLGGWHGPLANSSTWWGVAFGAGYFFAKACFFVFVLIWLRWTLPRLRVDQLMAMCWKYLVPIGFVCLIGTLLWMSLLGDRIFFGLIPRAWGI
jgi:NADH-quinone oxidoreductase subunit H